MRDTWLPKSLKPGVYQKKPGVYRENPGVYQKNPGVYRKTWRKLIPTHLTTPRLQKSKPKT
jgi:hypothetical protein